ncbi:MAG TPA: hypothetical protein VFE23_10690 [Usitatibacter sp.]|jgi:hypothetical protein|nr:hypothetical protein [Usitatibacter sp.]
MNDRTLMDDGREELELRIARLNGDHGRLEAAYALVLRELANAKQSGRQAEIDRASNIADAALFNLCQCVDHLRTLEAELSAIMVADDGT